MGISRKVPPLSHLSDPDQNNTLPRSTSKVQNRSQIGSIRGRKPSRFLMRFGTVNDNSFEDSRYTPYGDPSKMSSTTTSKEKGVEKFSMNSTVTNLSYSDAVKRIVENQKKPERKISSSVLECKDSVTLQICNLDSNCDEQMLRQYLLGQLKSITPILSLTIESPSTAKLKVPSLAFAKQVVAHMHRKKFGHKRIIVAYTRDSSSAETTALKSQVAGLLKDIPGHCLPIYKFRELFQTRFKSTVSILDLNRMPEVCKVESDANEEKIITLNADLVTSVQGSSLIDKSQHSVPYCIYHFRQSDRGWAEQELEPMPNVLLTIPQIQGIVHALLRTHKDDIPIASILYCIEGELGLQLAPNDQGVNLEHLISCVKSVQIAPNTFGIKVLAWVEESSLDKCDVSETSSEPTGSGRYGRSNIDPLAQIARETIELIKLSPKCTMKFNRFIPAYHNHFGKQCRVADYGYTRLIDLFEALSNVIQVMGDGENRLITLTHCAQVRRFYNDLFKVLRAQPNKSKLLSQLPQAFSHFQNYPFNVTDYGVCSLNDMIDGLNHNSSIVLQEMNNGTDILISIMKRKQTMSELEKTCTFAVEVVELLRNAPQYTILFKKFVRSYHYHFGFQCRLSDYGFTKLIELLEAISGVVKIEDSPVDDDRKIVLCQKIALRVFSEQLQDLIKNHTHSSAILMCVQDVLQLHKNKYGYQMAPQTLGYETIKQAMLHLPYIELFDRNEGQWMISHLNDSIFRNRSYATVLLVLESGTDKVLLSTLVNTYRQKFGESLTEKMIHDMKHALQMFITPKGQKMVMVLPVMKFILSIVSILEKNGTAAVIQIKDMMQLPINSCFEFGFPSVAALIQDHLDLFSPIDASHVHERSMINLRADCIFTNIGFKKYLEHCKSKNPPSAFVSKERRPNSQAFKPANFTYQPPPTSYNLPSSNDNITLANFDNCKSSSKSCSCLNVNSLPSSFPSCSFGPYVSTNCYEQKRIVPPPGLEPKNYYNGNCLNNHCTQSIQQYAGKTNGGVNLTNINDLFSLPNWDNWNTNTSMNLPKFYLEPPKPDTPPTRTIPVWFDPVWKNSPCEPGVTSLNIQLPKLKNTYSLATTTFDRSHNHENVEQNNTSGRAFQGF